MSEETSSETAAIEQVAAGEEEGGGGGADGEGGDRVGGGGEVGEGGGEAGGGGEVGEGGGEVGEGGGEAGEGGEVGGGGGEVGGGEQSERETVEEVKEEEVVEVKPEGGEIGEEGGGQGEGGEGEVKKDEEEVVGTSEGEEGGEKVEADKGEGETTGGGEEAVEERGGGEEREEDDKQTTDEEGDQGGGGGGGESVVQEEIEPKDNKARASSSSPTPSQPATPPDSRLQSSSRMGLQPPPLGNITEEEEAVEEEEEEEEEVDREELLQNCKNALEQQRWLRTENAQLQDRIAEYLSRRKTDERSDPGKDVTDQEKRYLQCIGALDQLKIDLSRLKEHWTEKEEEIRGFCEQRQEEVQMEMREFQAYQKEVALLAVDSRTGRRLTGADVERRQADEESRNHSVYQARLENIKLTNKIERQELHLKKKEELAGGMHMIDFEQLKVSNVDLAEKIEDRNEDISKQTSRVRSTVEVLTHVKEKLHFLQEENSRKEEHLSQLDTELSKSRDRLSRLKQARDSLRLDSQRLHQRGGLISHPQLLRDFEERQDQREELEHRLHHLQLAHSQLTIQCRGLRRKTEQARALSIS